MTKKTPQRDPKTGRYLPKGKKSLSGTPSPQDPIADAQRYLDNAREILSTKAGKKEGYYSDRKYVRMAGNTAWNGVLVALDAVLDVPENLKKNQRPDVNTYRLPLGQKNRKMLKVFDSAYDTLHKAMGYDGNLKVKIVAEGMGDAKKLLQWCKDNYRPK